ncbi:MAG: DUF342 domain-containing protein [Bacillota bacterium]
MSDLIKIDISRDKMIASVMLKPGSEVTRDDILESLKKKGVIYGVFEDVIEECVSGDADGVKIIARGTPPEQGKNGWVEILWDKKEDVGENESDKAVDYRETSNLTSVNEGVLLAVRHAPREGKPGIAVTGEPVAPAPLKEARIIAGKGVRLEENGDKVYSVTRGRPVFKGQGLTVSISVEPTYTVNGDVSLKTGNIRFKGDVIVTGNVRETMTLEASGSVSIGGVVSGAHVYCGESLTVQKTVISSEVVAGMGATECGKIKYLVQDIFNDLVKLLQFMDKIKEQSHSFSFSHIVNTLIDNRFKDIRANVRKLVTVKTFNLPNEVVEAVESAKIISGMQFTRETFKEMMQKFARAIAIMDSSEDKTASITLDSASSSTIMCSGPVTVTGKGCVNTTVYAGGNVKISGHFKGGEIYSEANVEVGELGSTLGDPPLVRVKSDKRVRVTRSVPGPTIQIGSMRVTVSRELGRSTFKLDKEGEIEIISG